MLGCHQATASSLFVLDLDLRPPFDLQMGQLLPFLSPEWQTRVLAPLGPSHPVSARPPCLEESGGLERVQGWPQQRRKDWKSRQRVGLGSLNRTCSDTGDNIHLLPPSPEDPARGRSLIVLRTVEFRLTAPATKKFNTKVGSSERGQKCFAQTLKENPFPLGQNIHKPSALQHVAQRKPS